MAKILLIDDDLELLKLYSALLAKMGHHASQATDGIDGLSKLGREKFDVIVTDLKMPRNLNGDIVPQILKESLNPKAAVVISSGHTGGKLIEAFSGNKRVHFLPKPVSSKSFVETINALLAGPSAKSAIDVRFINPILAATMELLGEKGFKVEKTAPPRVKKPLESSGDLSVMVGLVSAGFKGSISLSFLREGFIQLLDKMFDVKASTIDDENRDAIVEFFYAIIERSTPIFNKNELNFQMGSPSIVSGKDHCVNHTGLPTVVLTFGCQEFGQFRVEICSRT